MVIVHLSGGFGNQLYSYAFGYAVAKARGEELWIDTAIQDAPWFFRNPDILHMNITYDKRLTYKIGNKHIDKVFNRIRFYNAVGWTTKIIKEKDMPDYHKWFDICVNTKGNIYIKGNWSYEECFKYAKIDIFIPFNKLVKFCLINVSKISLFVIIGVITESKVNISFVFEFVIVFESYEKLDSVLS